MERAQRGGTRMVSFREGELGERLRERVRPSDGDDAGLGVGAVAKRDLTRYYAILDEALRGLRLGEADAMLICDALNGYAILDRDSARLIWAEVADAIRIDGLQEKWSAWAREHDLPECDGEELVRYLRDLSPAECWALADAVERWWLDTQSDPREALRRVGLVR